MGDTHNRSNGIRYTGINTAALRNIDKAVDFLLDTLLRQVLVRLARYFVDIHDM